MKFKQQDWAMLVAGVFFGLLISILVSKYVFSSANKHTQVDVVPKITSIFPAPSNQYFNSNAVDPTQIINIAPNNNTTPFNGSTGQ